MFELKVTTHFAAAHQLQMVGEKCENLHGHNWNVEVRVRGDKLDEAGVLVDFGIVKKHVRAIMKELERVATYHENVTFPAMMRTLGAKSEPGGK